MRTLVDTFAQTLQTLWAHKLRSFLTMFGIAWGVGSMLLLAGVGEGFRNGNRKQLETFGKNIIFFWGGRAPAVEGSFNSAKWFNLTYDDYLAIKNQSTLAVNLSPVIARDDIRAVSDYTSTNGQVSGVPPIYNQVRTVPLAVGRWINDDDNEQRRRVCILGSQMTRNIFPGRPAVGNTILLNGVRFQVVGVLSMIGHEEQNFTNIRIFIPFNTMRELFRSRATTHSMARQFRSSIISRELLTKTKLPRPSCMASSRAIMEDSIRRIPMCGKNGTRLRIRKRWARFLPRWIGSWAELAW